MPPEKQRALAPALVLAALLAGGCAAGTAARKPTDDASAVDLNLALAQGYLERGRLDLASDRLKRAIAKDPRNPAAHTLMAVLTERLGDQEKASLHYRRAVELAPESGLYLQNYARWLCRQGDFEAAQKHFARALADPLYDQREIALRNSGLCFRKAGDAEAAAARFRELLRLRATDPEALFQLASIHFERGDALRARAFLQRLESVAALDPEALLLGYRVEKMLGDARASEGYRKRLLEGFPESEEAREIDSEG